VIFLGRDVVLEVDGIVLGEVVLEGIGSKTGLWSLSSSDTAATARIERREKMERRLTNPFGFLLTSTRKGAGPE